MSALKLFTVAIYVVNSLDDAELPLDSLLSFVQRFIYTFKELVVMFLLY